MRFYALLNFQHVMGYLFVGLLFMVIFGLGLSYAHFRSADSERRMSQVVGRFREGIEDRDAPYPLMMILIIAGVLIWGLLYILLHGLLGVRI
jgi:hypothetical protein